MCELLIAVIVIVGIIFMARDIMMLSSSIKKLDELPDENFGKESTNKEDLP